MNYYAHSKENGEWQTLLEHLLQTAEIAQACAIPPLKKSAYLLGLMHDLGKYQKAFQNRLQNQTTRVEHAFVGAKEIFDHSDMEEKIRILLAEVIAGHHAGLPDVGSMFDVEEDPTLYGKMQKTAAKYDAFRAEIGDKIDYAAVEEELRNFLEDGEDSQMQFEMAVRYLFSCLTDADFLDTERFVRALERKKTSLNVAECIAAMDEKFRSFRAETEVQIARARLQKQAMQNIERDASVYLLDMPTGSGKTLCSMRLALERAKRTGKERIIYVIPYTSIIEQTADVFETLFPNVPILEHHSNFDFDEEIESCLKRFVADEKGDSTAEKLKRRTENWDCPIVITTNVQFFESIYSNRSGKLRKLHNMANSILVFDEIHTMPIQYFGFCMQAIAQLTTYYGSEAIFLTATMPDFAALYAKFCNQSFPMRDLLPDKSDYTLFEKCVYRDIGEKDVLEEIDPNKNNLIVFNKKSSVRAYYERYTGKKFFLTTGLTAVDRSKKLSEIQKILAEGKEKVTVFSTSLIEAGVDVDFECVYREICGVDNILQTAGRCNREGRRKKEESVVTVFRVKDGVQKGLEGAVRITESLIREYGIQNLMRKECICKYFEKRYAFEGWKILRNDAEVEYEPEFRTFAENFHLIENTTVSLVIRCAETEAEIAKLPYHAANRRLLQRYSATVNVYELQKMLPKVTDYEGVFVLEDSSCYSLETGLSTESESFYIF